MWRCSLSFFFFQAEDGIRDVAVTGVQTCALPIWARPKFAGRLQREVSRAQMRRLSICIHVRAGRVRINGAVLAANVKEHHLRVVLELEAQPVPAGLAGFELMREEFMVHPTYAAYFKFLVTELD